MRKTALEKKDAVCGGCVLVMLLVSVLGAVTSGAGASNSDAELRKLNSALKAIYAGSQDWERRRALKDYREKGAEVARWTDDGTMVKPDNAALLYYRALAHGPHADPCTAAALQSVMQGGKPDDRLRTYLGRCLLTIELTQLAGQIADCDWGFQYYRQSGQVMDTLKLLRQWAFLLDVHVRTLAFDGHDRAALENCLVMRQLARHLGDDIYVQYAISCGIDSLALRDILRVLSRMPDDEETLLWLRDQLGVSKGTPWRPHEALGKWRDMQLKRWRMHEGTRVFDRQWMLGQIENRQERREAMALTDHKLLVRSLRVSQNRYGLAIPSDALAEARRQCDKYLDEAIEVMEADIPYKDKREKLGRLEDDLKDRQKRWDPICLLEEAPGRVDEYYWLMMPGKAYLNAAQTAIEVFLAKARTGALPETLPGDLPKDPFNSQGFEYERTEKGFVLRFDPQNLSRIRERQFEFSVGNP